ncbi:hypothetical protein DFR70_12670 [Nocardia tenerifensis]|uniref:Uncharacterized protein n=1 Tax=Nocardia tenerifensis TaxID=228006 RepID=A0A318JL50_9NOCA|nr:hypothetical protein [Nocardia tenerifensis]PXX53949.1 hypothetical protein DFR70_12670 [Nocardia tenerifensis]
MQTWEVHRGEAADGTGSWIATRHVGMATSATVAERLAQADALFTPVELATMRCTLEDEAYAYGGYSRPQEIFNPGTAPRYLTEGPLKSLSEGERFAPTWLWVECYLRAHPDLYDETPATVEARQQQRTDLTEPMVNAAAEHMRTGHFAQAHDLLDRARLINPFEASTYAGMHSRVDQLAHIVDELGLTGPQERFEGVVGRRAHIRVGDRTFSLERTRGSAGLEWIVRPGSGEESEPITEALPTREVLPRLRTHLAEHPVPERGASPEELGTEADPLTSSSPGDQRESAVAVEVPAAASPILIEHTAEATLVRNTDKNNLALRQALHDAKFQWSRQQKFWYQRRATAFDTRTRRVGYLRASLTQLGLAFTETGTTTTPDTTATDPGPAEATPRTDQSTPPSLEPTQAEQDSISPVSTTPASTAAQDPAPTPAEREAPVAAPATPDQPTAAPADEPDLATVTAEPEPASTVAPASAGFRLDERLPAPQVEIPQSPRRRVAANLAAIQTVQLLERDNRAPTPAERETLAKWTSWGAVSQIFDADREEFRADAETLRTLIGEDGWKQANRTVINAHYTDPMIVEAMWAHLQSLGLNAGRILEPGCGAGAQIAGTGQTRRCRGGGDQLVHDGQQKSRRPARNRRPR